MKKRYSEYLRYDYKKNDTWFNPQVGWDTQLFIDPILIKNTKIKEFENSYLELINFYSKAVSYNKSNYPNALLKKMFSFQEIKEANLGFAYDSNNGSGLTGSTALAVLNNLEKFIDSGLFGISDFAEISLFDKNVSGDRITDMILNILIKDFLKYSVNIAKRNNFPLKKQMIKTNFNYDDMRWNVENVEIPYIVNEDGKEISVILVPKEFLVTTLYNDSDKLIDWIYHNDLNYVKEVFDYNLKKDLMKYKNKIINDIAENKRIEILEKYNENSINHKAYDIDTDSYKLDKIYELALEFYRKNFNKSNIKHDNSNMSVEEVAQILIDYLKTAIIDKKGLKVITNKGKFISEPQISKFMHIILDSYIKNSGYNVDISPETNSGNGPVDFKISRGDDKVLIENKLSTNRKLIDCIEEDKQIHTYLKQENCKLAYLIVFYNKESDIDKINELHRKNKNNHDYEIKIVDIDCSEHDSASKR